MNRSDRSLFHHPDQALPAQLPAQVLIAAQSLIGPQVVNDLHIETVTITPKDSTSHGLTINSGGASYTGNETRWLDATNTTAVTTVSSFGNLFTASWMGFVDMSPPATPGAGNVRVYAAAKGGVSNLYWIDDGGTTYDLSLLAFLQKATSASITSAVSIANSATETQLIGLTIPASTLAASSTLFFAASGVAGTTILAPTMTWRVRIGTTTLTGNVAASWAPTPGTSLSNKGWRIDGEITVRSAGAGGTCIANGVLTDELSSTLTDAVKLADQTSTVAVDTTVANILELSFKFGTADAANVLSCQTAFVGWARP